jgi:hypothetical protein
MLVLDILLSTEKVDELGDLLGREAVEGPFGGVLGVREAESRKFFLGSHEPPTGGRAWDHGKSVATPLGPPRVTIHRKQHFSENCHLQIT